MEFDLKSWLTGFLLELVGQPQGGGKGEPVAYLYGPDEVRLPPLPEWDTEKYPYAFIHENPGRWIALWAIDVPLTRKETSAENKWLKTNGPYNYVYWTLNGDTWATDDYSEGTNAEGSSWGTTLIWTNTDVPYKDDIAHEDGEIYMAASEPAPVYR